MFALKRNTNGFFYDRLAGLVENDFLCDGLAGKLKGRSLLKFIYVDALGLVLFEVGVETLRGNTFIKTVNEDG